MLQVSIFPILVLYHQNFKTWFVDNKSKYMITISSFETETERIFRRASFIQSILLVIGILDTLELLYSYASKYQDLIGHLSLLSSIQTIFYCAFLTSFTINLFQSLFFKVIAAYVLEYFAYQIRILNTFMEHITDGINTGENENFQMEIWERLRFCIGVDHNIRR